MDNPVSEINSGIVSIKFEGDKYRYWNNDKTLRVQSGSSFTIIVPDGYYITGINMTGASASNVDHGTFDSGNWTPTEGKNVSSVKFSPTATTKINTITINYAKAVAPELPAPTAVEGTEQNVTVTEAADGWKIRPESYPVTLKFAVAEGVQMYAKAGSAAQAAAEGDNNGYTALEGNTLKLTESGQVYSVYAMKDGVKSETKTVTADVPSGIAGIEAEDGEAVYFNLQGVRVENPENGIFIRVQNGKAVKIAK